MVPTTFPEKNKRSLAIKVSAETAKFIQLENYVDAILKERNRLFWASALIEEDRKIMASL